MTQIAYLPHGINSQHFRPILEGDVDYAEFQQFLKEFKHNNDVDFIVFWNNRNVRRKQPADVVLSFRLFCDKIPKKKAKRCALLMHTDIIDPNGTDLIAVKKAVCPDYKVIFSDQKLHTKFLNFYYNMADVTLNIASNEGFGLSGAESLMAGTPIINNVTGGLQDQMRFADAKGKWVHVSPSFASNHTGKYKKCGVWAKPVFPSNRSLQGSPQTPYIFDDRAAPEDVAKAIGYWYRLQPTTRAERGMLGREWVMSDESGMSAKQMCENFVNSINQVLEAWTPRTRFKLFRVDEERPMHDHLAVTW